MTNIDCSVHSGKWIQSNTQLQAHTNIFPSFSAHSSGSTRSQTLIKEGYTFFFQYPISNCDVFGNNEILPPEIGTIFCDWKLFVPNLYCMEMLTWHRHTCRVSQKILQINFCFISQFVKVFAMAMLPCEFFQPPLKNNTFAKFYHS
jgi:hypothetical protein